MKRVIAVEWSSTTVVSGPTMAWAKLKVGAWIEDRCNRRRRHSSIGEISTVNFEMQHCNQSAADQEAA